jgi:hypothetical protein
LGHIGDQPGGPVRSSINYNCGCGVRELPCGKLTKSYGKNTIFNVTTHYKLPFSIAMLVY